ncbi:diguanylate cyclase/phosphodiesterase (GGDEF & EAL domains) with PAS/PAC sensor(s) [hydrothermal vent metagenome]|uniref:Diguanylate cyclase/phosphodiesterase (GGDEF & EAL domains) with PAS/PAC sensor(S) n=1 Tax=hydrothermal vent metagenome TaxID=652676 RepID=A0A3B0WIR9_9ZZZZ
MKVLILENGRLFQKILQDLLIELNCTVSCVRTGEEGLNLLLNTTDDTRYDLIIASQHIFDKTGSEFISHCKNTYQKIPIILLTSEPNDTLLKNARTAGIKDIFPKTNITYLKSSIRYYVQGKKNFDIQGGKILYVEDSPSVAHIVTKYLKNLKLEVMHFSNAEEAFHAFSDNEFDLIITDVMLEGTMDGLSLVRMIRAANTDSAKTPILAMTSHDDTQLRIDLFHAGINDYVTKPPVEEELAARVNNLIINKRLADQVLQQQREAFNIAMTDKLTTCHNRHSLADYAPKYIKDALRYKHPLSVMILDLDLFKAINDEFGHTTGDIVLSSIGKLLMSSCRQGDIVSRIGGEEFLILLPHCDIYNAMKKAEVIRSMVELSKPSDLTVTTSIGVASLIEEHNGDFDKLYQAADTAVYNSKENGRNQVTADHKSIEVSELAQAPNE